MVSRIGIIRTGNSQSVWNAIHHIGFDPVWVDGGTDFDDLSHVILPGVGQFRASMDGIWGAGIGGKLSAFVQSDRPLLGICVGMQALVDSGDEGGETTGLGFIAGTVEKLHCKHLPHVGWNTILIERRHPVFEGIKNEVDFYFTHSYAPASRSYSAIIAETEYDVCFFQSVIGTNNIVGVQFHPEKSQKNGLKLLENFCNWDGKC